MLTLGNVIDQTENIEKPSLSPLISPPAPVIVPSPVSRKIAPPPRSYCYRTEAVSLIGYPESP